MPRKCTKKASKTAHLAQKVLQNTPKVAKTTLLRPVLLALTRERLSFGRANITAPTPGLRKTRHIHIYLVCICIYKRTKSAENGSRIPDFALASRLYQTRGAADLILKGAGAGALRAPRSARRRKTGIRQNARKMPPKTLIPRRNGPGSARKVLKNRLRNPGSGSR